MDNETKQWIVDRVVWVVGLTVGVLVAATASAEDRAGPSASRELSATAHRSAVALVSTPPVEAR